MPNQTRNKSKNVKYHAKQQAVLRYDINITDKMLKDMEDFIKNSNNQGKYIKTVEKQSNNISILLLTYNDNTFKIVYNKKLGQIVTFLPLTDRYISDPIGDLINKGCKYERI